MKPKKPKPAPKPKKFFDPNRIKNSEEAAVYRDALAIKQNNIDPITKSTLIDKVLDHQHFGDQKCRGVLNRNTNTFEGRVYNTWIRYIKNYTDLSLSEVLRNLADYLEEDYSSNKIHHTAIVVDTNKFKSLPSLDQRYLLENLKILEIGKNQVERTKQARDLIREGKLTTAMINTAKNQPQKKAP